MQSVSAWLWFSREASTPEDMRIYSNSGFRKADAALRNSPFRTNVLHQKAHFVSLRGATEAYTFFTMRTGTPAVFFPVTCGALLRILSWACYLPSSQQVLFHCQHFSASKTGRVLLMAPLPPPGPPAPCWPWWEQGWGQQAARCGPGLGAASSQRSSPAGQPPNPAPENSSVRLLRGRGAGFTDTSS